MNGSDAVAGRAIEERGHVGGAGACQLPSDQSSLGGNCLLTCAYSLQVVS